MRDCSLGPVYIVLSHSCFQYTQLLYADSCFLVVLHTDKLAKASRDAIAECAIVENKHGHKMARFRPVGTARD